MSEGDFAAADRRAGIMHENGDYWVAREKEGYGVYRSGITHSTLDGNVLYPKDADGLSIAIARCDYLANRKR